jgi:hypothetical protein
MACAKAPARTGSVKRKPVLMKGYRWSRIEPQLSAPRPYGRLDVHLDRDARAGFIEIPALRQAKADG